MSFCEVLGQNLLICHVFTEKNLYNAGKKLLLRKNTYFIKYIENNYQKHLTRVIKCCIFTTSNKQNHRAMTTIEKINELKANVNGAKTATVEGRQIVANSCEKLYNLIEDDVYNAGCEWMLKGIYNDLCYGNFAEPFLCEKKKETFTTIVEVYNSKILPRI